MKPFKTASLTVVLVLAAAQTASAAETYAYQLIPKRTHLIYTLLADGGNVQIFASVSGRIGFTVHDDGSITTSAFDLTIEGPLLDDLQQPIATAFFAPGDKLADFLAVDFAHTSGLAWPIEGLNGAPPANTAAFVGPDVSADDGGAELGHAFYRIESLESDPTWLTVHTPALPQFGGWFSVQPDDEPASSGGGIQLPAVRIIPNLQRVPEPDAATLLAFALFGLASARVSSHRISAFWRLTP